MAVRSGNPDGWVGVFDSLKAAEAERDRLEELGHVDGDHLEVREMIPKIKEPGEHY